MLEIIKLRTGLVGPVDLKIPSDLLNAVGLDDALGWQVSRLSSGERHRLAIVRALQRRPQALLLDEPTASLDVQATGTVETLIIAQCKAGVPVLLVTHDPGQAKRLAAMVLVMSAGQLTPERDLEE